MPLEWKWVESVTPNTDKSSQVEQKPYNPNLDAKNRIAKLEANEEKLEIIKLAKKEIGKQLIEKWIPEIPDNAEPQFSSEISIEELKQNRRTDFLKAAKEGDISILIIDSDFHVWFKSRSGWVYDTPYKLNDFNIDSETRKLLKIDALNYAIKYNNDGKTKQYSEMLWVLNK